MNINDLKPEKKPKMIGKYGESDKWERNPNKAKQSLKNANYKCEINIRHKTFTSQSTKQSYTESHHLIPLNHQDKFEYSLDVLSNLVSLCPNCHRKIHLAIEEERKYIIENLYNIRREELKTQGIDVLLTELLKLY